MNPPTESQVDEFVQEFASRSDRLLVVAAVSLIDTHLAEFIRLHLLPSRKANGKDDELFGPDCALGSFSAKINLSYRLGLIDAPFSDVLHHLRKIRNVYAHLPTPGGLESGEQAKLLKGALAKFEYEKAIWWDAVSDACNMSFRCIALHLMTKLMIGLQPGQKPSLPIPLKPSEAELKFFDLIGGKLSH